MAEACEAAGCALLGGETAELPGFYAPGEYDLAGFAVGVVSKKKIVDGTRVEAGDAVIGLRSSGLHSNGFSLARKVVEARGLKMDDRPAELAGKSVGETLLTPTRLYARHAQAVLAAADVRAMSHITGGGLPGNVPRVLPEGLGVRVTSSWTRAPIYDLVAKSVEPAEMLRTFNFGIGYVFVIPPADAARATEALRALGEDPVALGEVVAMPKDTPFESRVVFAEGTL
jgi:phosphoribosylformylglycinamidine cyclo-ligase